MAEGEERDHERRRDDGAALRGAVEQRQQRAAQPPPRARPARAARRCRRGGLRSGSARTGRGPRTRQTGPDAGAGASIYALRTSAPVTSGGWDLKHGHPKTQRAWPTIMPSSAFHPTRTDPRSRLPTATSPAAITRTSGATGRRWPRSTRRGASSGGTRRASAYDATRQHRATARGAWQHAAAGADWTDLRGCSPPGRRPARAHARVRALRRLDGQRARSARPGLPRVARSRAGGADVPPGDLHGARATAGCLSRPDGHGDTAGTVPIEVRPPAALVGRSRFQAEDAGPPPRPRVLEQLQEPSLARLLALRARHPVRDGAAIRRRLRLPEDPGRRIRLEAPLLVVAEARRSPARTSRSPSAPRTALRTPSVRPARMRPSSISSWARFVFTALQMLPLRRGVKRWAWRSSSRR